MSVLSARCLTVSALAGLLLAGGCLSKPITKTEAATLVRASAAFTRPKFAHIPRQLTFQNYYQSEYGDEGILSINDLASWPACGIGTNGTPDPGDDHVMQ